MLAGADIKLPTVPGTRDDTAGKCSLAKRTTLMRADAVEREVLAIHVKKRDDSIAGNCFARCPRRTVFCSGDADPLRHSRTAETRYGEQVASNRLAYRAAKETNRWLVRTRRKHQAALRAARRLGGVPFQRRCTHQYCSGWARITFARQSLYHCVKVATLAHAG